MSVRQCIQSNVSCIQVNRYSFCFIKVFWPFNYSALIWQITQPVMLTILFLMNHFLCMPFRFPEIVPAQTKSLGGSCKKRDWNTSLKPAALSQAHLDVELTVVLKQWWTLKKKRKKKKKEPSSLKAFLLIRCYLYALGSIRFNLKGDKKKYPYSMS